MKTGWTKKRTLKKEFLTKRLYLEFTWNYKQNEKQNTLRLKTILFQNPHGPSFTPSRVPFNGFVSNPHPTHISSLFPAFILSLIFLSSLLFYIPPSLSPSTSSVASFSALSFHFHLKPSLSSPFSMIKLCLKMKYKNKNKELPITYL